MIPPRYTALAAALAFCACERRPAETPPPATQSAVRPDVSVPAPDAQPAAPPPTVDPGAFQRFGCQTDAMPPHIVAGRATVTWRPARGGGAFSYRNLPARCGGAFPGQIVDGARTRPGDGAEFVVCMPDERRLDVGVLRRGPVAAGAQDVTHTANLVRLRIGLDRYVNLVSPAGAADPAARLTFGARNRSASGSARLGAAADAPTAVGTVDFEIDCAAAR